MSIDLCELAEKFMRQLDLVIKDDRYDIVSLNIHPRGDYFFETGIYQPTQTWHISHPKRIDGKYIGYIDIHMLEGFECYRFRINAIRNIKTADLIKGPGKVYEHITSMIFEERLKKYSGKRISQTTTTELYLKKKDSHDMAKIFRLPRYLSGPRLRIESAELYSRMKLLHLAKSLDWMDSGYAQVLIIFLYFESKYKASIYPRNLINNMNFSKYEELLNSNQTELINEIYSQYVISPQKKHRELLVKTLGILIEKNQI